MELEIKLKDAIQLRDDIVNSLKENRKKILDKSTNNDKKTIDELTLYQTQLSEDLINIKDKINKKNTELGINKLIYSLSERRELIITYDKLISNMKHLSSTESQEVIKSYTESINRLKEKKKQIEDRLEEINDEYKINVEIYSGIEPIKKLN